MNFRSFIQLENCCFHLLHFSCYINDFLMVDILYQLNIYFYNHGYLIFFSGLSMILLSGTEVKLKKNYSKKLLVNIIIANCSSVNVLTHLPRLKKLMIAKSKLNQVCYTTNDYEIVIKD